jgi:hypothetical protein
MIEREALIRDADRAGIAVIAINDPGDLA